MSWLYPLGFLGLIGLIVLAVIYLIKPNYQNKFISSTFVWKLSLKYRKKRLPISKLRNIILIICQVLAITACSFLLAQPFIDGDDANAGKEKVIIIDASANMLAEVEGVTRFDRAVDGAEALAKETLDNGGAVSVILASRKASVLVQRLDSEGEEAATNLPVRERIGRFKAVPYGDFASEAQKITAEMTEQLDQLVRVAKLS